MKALLGWALLIGSTVGFGIHYRMWKQGNIGEKDMVGVTLSLSYLALIFSAITTLFVS